MSATGRLGFSATVAAFFVGRAYGMDGWTGGLLYLAVFSAVVLFVNGLAALASSAATRREN